MTSVICYGDVIKLSAKSAHVDGEAGCVGFVEYKGNHQLLVVPPVKDILKDNFLEAEFIMYVQVFFCPYIYSLLIYMRLQWRDTRR